MGADLYITFKGDEIGYFRDSYNNSNLLWQFGLDYWVWLESLLNKQGDLTPAKIKLVLKTLKDNEPVFEKNLASQNHFDEWTLEDGDDKEKYYRQKYEQLKKFLNLALKKDLPIGCSI